MLWFVDHLQDTAAFRGRQLVRGRMLRTRTTVVSNALRSPSLERPSLDVEVCEALQEIFNSRRLTAIV